MKRGVVLAAGLVLFLVLCYTSTLLMGLGYLGGCVLKLGLLVQPVHATGRPILKCIFLDQPLAFVGGTLFFTWLQN